MRFHINASCWHHYDQETLQDLMEEHPFLFPDFERRERVVPEYALHSRRDEPYTDPWGCVWETSDDGITGIVHYHPLADWDSFPGYKKPDPVVSNGQTPLNWDDVKADVLEKKRKGELVNGGIPHGHTFLRLQDIRGYENLIFDMTDNEPRLDKLIDMIAEFNYEQIIRWLELEPDVMRYPEDLGMQVGPMISPEHFRRYIKPVYEQIMKPARDVGCIVHMHSDGDIRTLVDDLIDGGVEVINLHDLVNGIDWIAGKFAGRTCVDLDIDRQCITVNGTPEQIDNLIREEVCKIARKEGGLMMIYGLYPGVPLRNIKALMDAMSKYAFYFS
jgi:uroporphyrinogen decarboxylase